MARLFEALAEETGVREKKRLKKRRRNTVLLYSAFQPVEKVKFKV